MHKLFTIQLNFRPVKLKALADDKINVTEPLNFVLGRAENIVGKGENAGYHYGSKPFSNALTLP